MILLTQSTVGKKILMAITGQVLLIFIVIHTLGNLTIYSAGLNAYAAKLHSLPVLLWLIRLLMISAFIIHIIFAFQLYFENKAAKPESYAKRKYLKSVLSGRTMIWTGLVIFVFVIYHLLHFTFQVTHPDISSGVNIDSEGLPNVYGMVVSSFQNVLISSVYIISMTALFLHLMHGIQSSFQTLGLNNENTLPVITRTGLIVSLIIFAGFASVPVLIIMGVIKG